MSEFENEMNTTNQPEILIWSGNRGDFNVKYAMQRNWINSLT